MLDINELYVSYGAVEALRGISLSVKAGQTVAVIGANGAGKSTLMRSLSGLVQPRSGTLNYQGKPLSGRSAAAIARMGISQVPEGRQIFPSLSVDENMRLGGFWLPTSRYKATRARVLSLFPRLQERLRQQAGLLSGGEQQMLAMARAMMAEPKLLLLDEPSMGLAPLIVDEIFKVIAELKSAGTTILLVEQSVQRALKAADYAYVVELGKIVAHDQSAKLIQRTDIVDAYLGQKSEQPRKVSNG